MPENSKKFPLSAMLLAAGLGTRMRPLTLNVPKPLVKVAGQALIDRVLDSLEKTHVKQVVVNIHHLGEQIKAHLTDQQASRPFHFIISDESAQLLDSGGGVVKALPFLGTEPFLILNTDTFWQENALEQFPKNVKRFLDKNCGENKNDQKEIFSNLNQLAEIFDIDKMDMLLLTVRRQQAAFPERGDFLMNVDGRLSRASPHDPNAVIYAGAMIVNPAIFANQTAEPHSLNIYFDRAIAKQRLYGLALQGSWYTVGTMAAVAALESSLSCSTLS